VPPWSAVTLKLPSKVARVEPFSQCEGNAGGGLDED
jgi:hypothetical protein